MGIGWLSIIDRILISDKVFLEKNEKKRFKYFKNEEKVNPLCTMNIVIHYKNYYDDTLRVLFTNNFVESSL